MTFPQICKNTAVIRNSWCHISWKSHLIDIVILIFLIFKGCWQNWWLPTLNNSLMFSCTYSRDTRMLFLLEELHSTGSAGAYVFAWVSISVCIRKRERQIEMLYFAVTAFTDMVPVTLPCSTHIQLLRYPIMWGHMARSHMGTLFMTWAAW